MKRQFKDIEARRQRMIDYNHSRKYTKELRLKMGAPKKGKPLSEEHKNKIAQANKGKNNWTKGRPSPRKGTKCSEEHIRKVKETIQKQYANGREPWSKGTRGLIKSWNKGQPMKPETRRKMREWKIKRVEMLKNNGEPIHPNIGNNETFILDSIEKSNGIKLERQYRVAGYFVDGYCVELNIAFEVDEKHHLFIEEKDKRREQEIKEELGCQIIRIKDY